MSTLADLLGIDVETTTFGMLSTTGAQAVRNLVNEAVDAFEQGASEKKIANIISSGRHQIEAAHTEVYDTEVRESTFAVLEHRFAEDMGLIDAKFFVSDIIANLR